MPSDLFTLNSILPPPGTTLPAARRVRPRPPAGGDPGVPEARTPGAGRAAAARGAGRRAGRGAVYAAPSPPSAARTPPARPGAARRLPRLTSLKLWDFLLLFLSENSMVLAGGRRRGLRPGGRPAGGGSGGRGGGGGAGSCHPAAGAPGPRSAS